MPEVEKVNIDSLASRIEEYFKTQQELNKLKTIEKVTEAGSAILVSYFLSLIFLFVITFASLALAYMISMYIGKAYSGFLIVAGIHLLLGLIIYFSRDAWLKKPILNSLIKNILKNENNS